MEGCFTERKGDQKRRNISLDLSSFRKLFACAHGGIAIDSHIADVPCTVFIIRLAGDHTAVIAAEVGRRQEETQAAVFASAHKF